MAKARYTLKTWNGKYGNPARFIVLDNQTQKYAEYAPARPHDITWVRDDLTKVKEYSAWESFENEPLDDLDGVVF